MPRKPAQPSANTMVEQAWRLAQGLETKSVDAKTANAIASQHKTILETVKVVKSMHSKGAAPKALTAFKR